MARAALLAPLLMAFICTSTILQCIHISTRHTSSLVSRSHVCCKCHVCSTSYVHQTASRCSSYSATWSPLKSDKLEDHHCTVSQCHPRYWVWVAEQCQCSSILQRLGLAPFAHQKDHWDLGEEWAGQELSLCNVPHILDANNQIC